LLSELWANSEVISSFRVDGVSCVVELESSRDEVGAEVGEPSVDISVTGETAAFVGVVLGLGVTSSDALSLELGLGV
jgi:hypothetical protein